MAATRLRRPSYLKRLRCRCNQAERGRAASREEAAGQTRSGRAGSFDHAAAEARNGQFNTSAIVEREGDTSCVGGLQRGNTCSNGCCRSRQSADAERAGIITQARNRAASSCQRGAGQRSTRRTNEVKRGALQTDSSRGVVRASKRCLGRQVNRRVLQGIRSQAAINDRANTTVSR